MNEQKVLSKGATDMVKAINLLRSSTLGLEAMKNELTNIDYELTEKRVELDKLTVALDETERQRLIDIDLKAREKMTSHIDAFLLETNRISMNKERYEHLLNLDLKFEDEVRKITSESNNRARSEYTNALALKEAEFKAKEAENNAQLKSYEGQLVAAKNEAKMWQDQLNSERAASIERAKASSIGSVNISGAK